MRSSERQSRRVAGSAHAPRVTTARRLAGPSARRGDRTDVCEVLVVDREKIARAEAALPSSETMARLAETLRALGDQTRLQIVCALAANGVDELCVCDLATLVGVSDSAVSHSLRTLRQLGLVRYRKAGKIAYYRLDDDHVSEIVHEGVRHIEERS